MKYIYARKMQLSGVLLAIKHPYNPYKLPALSVMVSSTRSCDQEKKNELEIFTWNEYKLQSLKLDFSYVSVAWHQYKQSPNFKLKLLTADLNCSCVCSYAW